MISFGALIAFSVVNLSVIKHFYIDQKERSSARLLSNLVLPFIGFSLTVWLWTSLSGTTFIVGGIWMLGGLVLLAIVTRGFRTRAPMLDLSEVADVTEADVERSEPERV